MENDIDTRESSLIADVLAQCIVVSDTSTSPPTPAWDELALLRDLALLQRIADSWANQLVNSQTVVCPVGTSGLSIATVAARKYHRPMIWIDGDGRVIPESRPIRNLRVAVVDFHSYIGAHFSLAHSRLDARKASQVSFFCVVDCDNVPGTTRLQLPTPINSIISVSKHFSFFAKRFRSLGVEQEERVADRLADGHFWGRHVQ